MCHLLLFIIRDMYIRYIINNVFVTCKAVWFQRSLLAEDLEEPAVSILSVPSKCAEQAEEFVRKVKW